MYGNTSVLAALLMKLFSAITVNSNDNLYMIESTGKNKVIYNICINYVVYCGGYIKLINNTLYIQLNNVIFHHHQPNGMLMSHYM